MESLMKQKNPVIGFIGCGKMAQAMMRGMIQGFVTPASNIHAADPSEECIKAVSDVGINTHAKNVDVVKAAEVVVIAVKPNVVVSVLQEIASAVGTSTLVVSIAAGVRIKTLQKHLKSHARIVRVMPNTPALVREGATAIAADPDATPEDIALVEEMMSAIGTCVRVKESHMNAVTGLSGSGPAYGYMMIEAMADGGVRAGLSRREAQLLAAQTLLGAAKMVLETNDHPAHLKDQVCSPNGTTIAGVHALEDGGFRGAVITAVAAAAKRAEELGFAE
ncbi:delta-1-pyrroline-5-carboxylate reductase [Salpingoeca rosetta]|uniref:Pyrroline-5-carboxylate reductase n=1 Tax=Salpingoeca rosetta (strain ATCC 50818 / BSB-021) TaxID=946362 RepID=F2UC99_SALR5|nr:delta-1-pyrroline-5-carboxylate reductase [Salpingoeca rosetta]EGD74206.1 delta-1-pyrroline-5-carboxylate reductase [Salpingoeca rosetta]|eukprot:XP_004993106.1 delta-1-pyrroline-5-carboxylate reductase [Salpingoeca rosetta]